MCCACLRAHVLACVRLCVFRAQLNLSGKVEVGALFSSDKLLETRRQARHGLRQQQEEQQQQHWQQPQATRDAAASKFNFVNLAQQYSRTQGALFFGRRSKLTDSVD
jgi:hypothetical protein